MNSATAFQPSCSSVQQLWRVNKLWWQFSSIINWTCTWECQGQWPLTSLHGLLQYKTMETCNDMPQSGFARGHLCSSSLHSLETGWQAAVVRGYGNMACLSGLVFDKSSQAEDDERSHRSCSMNSGEVTDLHSQFRVQQISKVNTQTLWKRQR